MIIKDKLPRKMIQAIHGIVLAEELLLVPGSGYNTSEPLGADSPA